MTKIFFSFLLLCECSLIFASELSKENDQKETLKIFLHSFLESEVTEQSTTLELAHLVIKKKKKMEEIN